MADGEPIRVFVLAGQSNMQGTGEMSALPTSPVDLSQPQEDILYHFWILTGGGLHESSEWSLLRPLWPGFPGTTYGPELTFGRTTADGLAGERIAIVKVAAGGTDLQEDWHPSGENGTMYQTMLDQVDLALERLRAQDLRPIVSGFVWVQGEGDANNVEKATEYEENLRALFGGIRDDWGIARLPAVYNQLHLDVARPEEAVAALRQSQANVADTDPYASMVNIDDLPLKSDFVHFTGATALELGERLAAAIDPLLLPIPELGDMNLSGFVDFDDIAPFVAALGNIDDYQAVYGIPAWVSGDLDEDGDLDFDDVAPFAERLGAGSEQMETRLVAEPSSLALLLACTLLVRMLMPLRAFDAEVKLMSTCP
jgi:hypothetical protein